MPNRGWLSDTAVTGFIVGAIFTVAAATIGFVSGERYHAGGSGDRAEDQYTADNAAPKAPPSEGQQPQAGAHPNLCDGPGRDPTSDLCQQWRMANAARKQIALLSTQNTLMRWEVGLIAGTLALAVVGSFFAWKAIEANRQEVRAYVHLSHESSGLEIDRAAVVYSEGRHTIGASLAVINTGQTPARITNVSIKLDKIPAEKRRAHPPIYSDMLVCHDGGIVLSRGETLSLAGVEFEFEGALSTDFVLYGFVDYTDVFGVRHRGGYARRYGRPAHDSNNLVYVTEEGWNYDRVRLPGEGSET